MTRLLERWGFDVTVAESLTTALERLDTGAFDAILSDIALPDGTGYALISEARRRGQRFLAIALSGYTYPEEVNIAKLTGFDHHLSKPCDCQKLRQLLDDKINSNAATVAG
jgi:CheY-like chemotaxis protein